MKKLILLLAIVAFQFTAVKATTPPDEGMWLPMFIKDYNYAEMQKLGLKLTPEQMYDINNSSLKDAIVQLGSGFCTGEMISKNGLMLTNHHCGYSYIVEHSTPEHDYLKDGFAAMSLEEEIPNPGFTVSFLVRMDDVTKTVLAGTDTLKSEAQIEKSKKAAIRKLEKENSEEGKYKVVVKPFYEGNEFYMFIYETYKDVRLVFAPPSAVGKFGGDTDNWMWPRHTGDFTIFRIYTGPDGKPAEYAADNVPLKPKHYLPINIQGIEKGDYAMIWGYPGTTTRFMTSYEVKHTAEVFNPTVVNAFDHVLPVIREAMHANDTVRINYADSYAGYANWWKKLEGEAMSLKKLRVEDKKSKMEAELTEWINKDPERVKKYGNVLAEIADVFNNADPVDVQKMWYAQVPLITSKYGMMGLRIRPQLKDGQKKFTEEEKAAFITQRKEMLEGEDLATEKAVLVGSLKLLSTLPKEAECSIITYINTKFNGDYELFVDEFMNTSIYTSDERFEKFLDKPSAKKLDADLGVQFSTGLYLTLFSGQGGDLDSKLAAPRKLFVAALKEMNQGTPMYPDANSTMRTTYGKVVDYYPYEAVHYNWFTTTQGILDKEIPNDPEFDVPARLKKLLETKDFGMYGKNGELRVCFLTDNDITGGNSGSPVINANGELIGCAFDGNWEALSSDIIYNPEKQRTICVDAAYILFIVDKLGGAGYLLDEMTIVK